MAVGICPSIELSGNFLFYDVANYNGTLLVRCRSADKAVESSDYQIYIVSDYIIDQTVVTNAIQIYQTAAVTIISYKPLSDLNFARYTILYGRQLHALSPFGDKQPFGVYK